MVIFNKKIDRFFLQRAGRTIRKEINRLGNERQCYVCKRTFSYFSKFRGGWKKAPVLFRELNMVGSDLDNYGCLFCGAKDRVRHLYMFFDKLKIWDQMKDAGILHFAPEASLTEKIVQCDAKKYVKADLHPQNETIEKIDATNIPYDEGSFDIVLFTHILEHIPDYTKALREIYRVLKPGGFAILQTPYSTILENNLEDKGINTDMLRLIVYGQEDHVRIFSEKQFFESIRNCGFKLEVTRHSDYFSDRDTFYYGVNKDEDLIRAVKPA